MGSLWVESRISEEDQSGRRQVEKRGIWGDGELMMMVIHVEGNRERKWRDYLLRERERMVSKKRERINNS